MTTYTYGSGARVRAHLHEWTTVTTIGGITVETCTCGANRTR